MANDYVKIRHTRDIIGTEICGSIKNVIAIASGMLDGMGYPISTSTMFITESLHDIKALIKALGGNKKTILSVSYTHLDVYKRQYLDFVTFDEPINFIKDFS